MFLTMGCLMSEGIAAWVGWTFSGYLGGIVVLILFNLIALLGMPLLLGFFTIIPLLRHRIFAMTSVLALISGFALVLLADWDFRFLGGVVTSDGVGLLVASLAPILGRVEHRRRERFKWTMSAIERGLRHGDENQILYSIEQMYDLGAYSKQEVLELVASQMSGSSPRSRELAVTTLAALCDKVATPTLLEILGDGDEDEQVRLEAVVVLAQLEDPGATPVLMKIFSNESEPTELRLLAGYTAKNMGHQVDEGILEQLSSVEDPAEGDRSAN